LFYAKKIPFEIQSQACPLFVPLVEDALFEGPIVEAVIERYLQPLALQEDLVILGCTHYPFLRKSLEKLYPKCAWIEAGQALLEDPVIASFPKDTKLENRRLQLHFTRNF
jgi:glutamate racemase